MADSRFGPADGIIIEVRLKRTGVLLGRHYVCEACGKKSVLIKPDENGDTELPKTWSRFHKVMTSTRGRFGVVYAAKCKTCTNREIVESERARPGIHSRMGYGEHLRA